ncbi:MAG: hypothetical protein H7323_15740 [Frankiales bacterium]|nr:hypothetical protein [Frankiales bacterium]
MITEGGLLKQASGRIKEKITERLQAREGRLDALARASDLSRKRVATKNASG